MFGHGAVQNYTTPARVKSLAWCLLPLVGCSVLVVSLFTPVFAQQFDRSGSDSSEWRAPEDKFATRHADPFSRHQGSSSNSDRGRFESGLVGGQSGASSKDFFEQGSAATVFSGRATLTAPPKVHILNAEVPELEEDLEIDPPHHASEQAQQVAAVPLEERLKQKYGDPNEDAPVLAKEDAPAPMKAMMEAFEANDEKLAYRYARQYVKFRRESMERAAKIVQLSNYAEAEQGYRAPVADGEEPDYEGLRYAASQDEGEPGGVEPGHESLSIDLDPRLQDFIRQAEAEEDSNVAATRMNGKAPAPQLDERTERIKIRQRYGSKMPRVGDGPLLVYLFIRPSATAVTLKMLSAVDKVAAKYRGQAKIQFVALTVDQATGSLLDHLRKKSKVTIPVRSGSGFAEKVNVRQAPALLFVPSGKGRALLEVGDREWFHIDELILISLGR
jgi:hypothetical protein